MLFDKFFQSIALGCTALLLVTSSASAHHSRAEFEDNFQEITGEIVGVNWSNPHPSIDLRVADKSEIVQIQVFGSATSVGRAGVSDELFAIGDRVTVLGSYSTRRPNYALGTNMLLADGREAILTRTVESYWSGEFIGGIDAFTASGPKMADAALENRGLFRVWSSTPQWRETAERNFSLTEYAVSEQAKYDLVNNAVSRGEVPGMPVQMMQPGPQELIDRGEEITLHSMFYATRTIHMEPSENAEDQPLSELGYSIGHWEGDDLVVVTTRISWPFFTSGGIPQTDSIRIVERFTLSEDQARLDYILTATDPVIFTEPATYKVYRIALDVPPLSSP